MDPTTVIIILATHLVCSGGLYYLIGREMPPRGGMGYWAAGAVVFGLAYIGRLALGLLVSQPWALVLDATMVLAALMFIAGLRQFVGRTPPRWYGLLGALLLYGLAQAAAVTLWDAVGRHALLNLILGLLYFVLAANAFLARDHQGAALRLPLAVLTVLMGVLALLTALRGLYITYAGTESMYRGLPAQIYYGYASLAAVMLGLNLVWMVFVRLNRQLAELASRDALTRVFNRNGLDDALTRHFAARDPQPVTLLQVDIDHFKSINDRFGHATGDAVLRAVAESLASRVRGNDFVARVGGEEFIVGCVGGDMGVALALGTRLRDGIVALRVPATDGRAQVSCTVSVGVSRSFRNLSDWEQASREADRALYAAKSAGRNRVVAFAQT